MDEFFLKVETNTDGDGVVSFSRVVDREKFGENNFFEVTFDAREEGCQEEDMICQNYDAVTTLRIQV